MPAQIEFQCNLRLTAIIVANGHIESTFYERSGKWSPLKFVEDSYLRVHGLSPGLNYGQQAFEGLKAFRTPGDHDIVIFRPEAHAARFQHSSYMLGMPLVPIDMFVEACKAAVAKNAVWVPPHESGWSLYCRPLLFGSSRSLVPGPADEYKFCVYIFPMPSAPPRPVKAIVLDEFDRAAPKGTGTAKAGGNYAGVLRWAGLAKREGFGITLHLDSVRHEYVDEFSLCGFLGVKSKPISHNGVLNGSQNGTPNGTQNSTQNGIQNGTRSGERGNREVVLVVPDSPSALDSLTSESIQQIARSWGWKVEKRPVPYTELPEFEEVMGTGTAVGLTSIRSISRRRDAILNQLPPSSRVVSEAGDDFEVIQYIPDKQDGGGPVFNQLLSYFRAVQFGKEQDCFDWLCKVDAQKELGGLLTP